MAYKTRLHQTCNSCLSNATWEVFNKFNASCGSYCGQHASLELARLKALEKLITRHGAVTGRFKSDKPNMANEPKNKSNG